MKDMVQKLKYLMYANIVVIVVTMFIMMSVGSIFEFFVPLALYWAYRQFNVSQIIMFMVFTIF